MANFSQSLLTAKASGRIPVIADIKCRSPQHGDLLRGRDPVACAEMLAQDGAPALSVVTEPLRFGGSLALLERIVKATALPVLRKDFVETPDDLARTRDSGATAILLMIAVLNKVATASLPLKDSSVQRQDAVATLLETLYAKSLDLGLEPLIEVHTADEMAIARRLGATLIGINNRDITRWECDDGTVQTTQHLIRHAPAGATLISESGIATPADARAVIQAGCTAVLIGTALWQAPDLRQAFVGFQR